MSRNRILQIGSVSERFDRRLAATYPTTPLWTGDKDEIVKCVGAGIDIVVTTARSGCDADLIDALPKLRAICCFGVGIDAIDIDAARQRGVAVSNTPDVLNDCVADLAMGLILDVSRRLTAGDRFVRSLQWLGAAPVAGRKVFGKKLGIVGLGRIGAVLVRRASGFDMEIGYHNRRPNPALPHAYFESVAGLAEWADFLVLVVPGGSETLHLVGARELEALGPQGVLINVARGSVVDQEALVGALTKGVIGGAGLDVYENEPEVPSELFGMDNVVLLPHVGSNTFETRLAMEELVFANIDAFLKRGRLLTAAG